MKKPDKFIELQTQAEWYVDKNSPKTAKSIYEKMLKLTRDGTIKQGLVLDCINDIDISIKKSNNCSKK